MDPIELSVFANRMEAVCDEMGAMLRNAAFSPNIRDRLDFSCAVFDQRGELCAQAAHIPVHLGSMAYAMRGIVASMQWGPGDTVILNDPYLGGTHLPDVTVITPVFVQTRLIAFAVNRAHHADVGAVTPGSMPISSALDEEGLIIEPAHLARAGKLDEILLSSLTRVSRNPNETRGDIAAQMSANRCGVTRLLELIEDLSATGFRRGLTALNAYGERLALSALRAIPEGEYAFSDVMDDDGQGTRDIPIRVCLKVHEGRVEADFAGTHAQVTGNINCPLSVAAAAVYYVFRCLMPENTPACAGVFRPISISAPEGCLLNARRPAAVAAGNVETSTRIVDVVMGALAQALPERIPAASHGSMNNVAMGNDAAGERWDYYETIGGGMGAGAKGAGLSAIQTHMTNTLNTPIEVVETRFPLRIVRYAIRRGSGGDGSHRGGDGLIREFEFSGSAQVSLLTERRANSPWGIAGGSSGKPGVNWCNGKRLPGKVHLHLKSGDRLLIETPGGGGWGIRD